VDPKKIRAQEGDVTARTTTRTVPYGTELVSCRYQALRTWLPSFSPSGTTKRQYVSTFSKPHHDDEYDAFSTLMPFLPLRNRSKPLRFAYVSI
jgi:hypothetical protein